MEQEIITFYEDETKQKVLFPTTTSNAVKWDETQSLPQYLDANLGLQMELVWENANPSAQFPAQTITIPELSQTKNKVIYILANGNLSYPAYNLIPILNIDGRHGLYASAGTGQSQPTSRELNINGNTITFGDGYFGIGVANTIGIPLKIYITNGYIK